MPFKGTAILNPFHMYDNPILLSDREEVMISDIVERLALANDSGTLSSMRIHILHVELWLDSDDYSPVAEIGLVEMTLRKGIKYVVSQLLDPGNRKIPKG